MQMCLEARKDKEIFLEVPESEFSCANTLILANKTCQISDLQNPKTINLYCLRHQVYVTVTIES